MSSPVATPTAGRRGLLRWTVASLATAALVVSGSGLVVFAQSGDGQSQGPQFVPADAAAYVEVRLDMPAGQHEAVAQMMTAFPGFADAGSFDLKVNEMIAGLGAQMGAAMPEGDLIGDVLTGEIGVALSGLESAMMGEDPTIIAGLATADAEAARTMMESLMAQASADVTQSSYNDVTIMTDPSSTPPMSVAMHGDWMLLASGEDTMANVIDVLDGNAPSLADDADFAAAWSRLPTVRLGAAWMDFAPFTTFLDMAGMMAQGQTGMALPMDDLAAMMPVDMVASLVAANDGMTLQLLVTPSEATPQMPVGESDLAMAFPADTQLYIETRELGATVESALNQLIDLMAEQAQATPEGSADMGGMAQIEMLIGEQSPITNMLGAPLPEFLDFVGDAGVGAGLSSDGLWLGIAAELNDPAAADKRVANLMSVLQMFAMQSEGAVTIETGDVGGVEVTTITLPIEDVMAETGVPLAMGDTIDVALTDDALLIGLGDFVESAILGGGDTLGASAGYVDALGADTVNSGVLYVNVRSLLSALDPILTMSMPEWSEVAPYATGFDRMIAVGTEDDGIVRARMTVIVGQ